MAQSSRSLVLILLSSVFLTGQQQGSGTYAKPRQLDGAWRMTWDSGERIPSEFSRKKVVVFKSTGTGADVQVSDPETNTTSSGKVSPTGEHDTTPKVQFTLPIKTGLPGTVKSVTMNGSLSGNTLSGTMKIDAAEVHWSAVRLPSAWECSNHKNPSHVATSEEEMRSYTAEHKCTGWHKLKTD